MKFKGAKVISGDDLNDLKEELMKEMKGLFDDDEEDPKKQPVPPAVPVEDFGDAIRVTVSKTGCDLWLRKNAITAVTEVPSIDGGPQNKYTGRSQLYVKETNSYFGLIQSRDSILEALGWTKR